MVLMRPSVYLGLTEPLPQPNAASLDHHLALIEEGRPIAAPYLGLRVDEQGVHAHGHEGRHRALACQVHQGDRPIPVVLIGHGLDVEGYNLRASRMSRVFFESLHQDGLWCEMGLRRHRDVFEAVWHEEHGVFRPGKSEDHVAESVPSVLPAASQVSKVRAPRPR